MEKSRYEIRSITLGGQTMIIDPYSFTVEIWNLEERKKLTSVERPHVYMKYGLVVFLNPKNFFTWLKHLYNYFYLILTGFHAAKNAINYIEFYTKYARLCHSDFQAFCQPACTPLSNQKFDCPDFKLAKITGQTDSFPSRKSMVLDPQTLDPWYQLTIFGFDGRLTKQ